MAGRTREGNGTLKCSFCGKSQNDVRKLIAGPTVYICDECIELCNDIIAEEWEEEKSREIRSLPKPAEIKTVLEGGNVAPFPVPLYPAGSDPGVKR